MCVCVHVYVPLHMCASMSYTQCYGTHAFPLFTLLCTCCACADSACTFTCLHSHPHTQPELHSLLGWLQNKAYTL